MTLLAPPGSWTRSSLGAGTTRQERGTEDPTGTGDRGPDRKHPQLSHPGLGRPRTPTSLLPHGFQAHALATLAEPGPHGPAELSGLSAASGDGPGPRLDVPDGAAAGGPGGGLAEGSTDPASFRLSNEYSAKISVKLPETLKVPHRPHNRAGEGSQLIKVTMLFKGVFLGSQVVNRVL